MINNDYLSRLEYQMRMAELERAATRNRLIRESRAPSRRERRLVRRRLVVRTRPRSRFATLLRFGRNPQSMGR